MRIKPNVNSRLLGPNLSITVSKPRARGSLRSKTLQAWFVTCHRRQVHKGSLSQRLKGGPICEINCRFVFAFRLYNEKNKRCPRFIPAPPVFVKLSTSRKLLHQVKVICIHVRDREAMLDQTKKSWNGENSSITDHNCLQTHPSEPLNHAALFCNVIKENDSTYRLN